MMLFYDYGDAMRVFKKKEFRCTYCKGRFFDRGVILSNGDCFCFHCWDLNLFCCRMCHQYFPEECLTELFLDRKCCSDCGERIVESELARRADEFAFAHRKARISKLLDILDKKEEALLSCENGPSEIVPSIPWDADKIYPPIPSKKRKNIRQNKVEMMIGRRYRFFL